ncbi:uncharacterized protein LOC106665011 [Cimex lectularius]|uniref:Protein sleepless n=1 Tax=Cimex lectularius TaxID=79782 RepID=A0A8I6RMZ1_CIMLE|nr:uncharacterized protein LOC106665011 [Cimex lectularius]
MAVQIIRPIFLLCALSCLVQLGWGLDCYKCSTIYYEDCHDLQNISKAEVETCPNSGEPTYCTKVTFQYQHKQVTHRGCAIDDCNKELQKLQRVYSFNAFNSCDFCTGNLCNSAANIDLTVTFVIALLISASKLL